METEKFLFYRGLGEFDLPLSVASRGPADGLTLALANRGYVLQTGELVLEGTGSELLADPRIRAAYLGEELES